MMEWTMGVVCIIAVIVATCGPTFAVDTDPESFVVDGEMIKTNGNLAIDNANIVQWNRPLLPIHIYYNKVLCIINNDLTVEIDATEADVRAYIAAYGGDGVVMAVGALMLEILRLKGELKEKAVK